MTTAEIRVRGGGTPAELAAVLAVLLRREPIGPPDRLDGLAAWRAGRRTALTHAPGRRHRG